MAQITGWACDHCHTTEQTEKANDKPKGWYELRLPQSELDYGDASRVRDLCSAKCLTAFARERKKAVEGPGKSRLPDAVLKAYEAAGVAEAQRGAYARKHNREHAGEDDKDPECVLCIHEAEV